MDDKKYRYRVLREQMLVIKYYSGNLSIKDLFEYVEITGDDSDYLPSMFVLNDLRDCYINIEGDAIIDFISKVRESPKVYAKRKIVFLTNNPNQVVFSTMLNMLKKENFIDLYTVSTIGSAFKHLMISDGDFDLIHRTLDELKWNGTKRP